MSPDPWGFWREALAGNVGPIHDGDPQQGFYRARLDKNTPYVPVAIWIDGTGSFLCRVGYDDLYHMRPADEMWTWCADQPVSHEAYQIAARTHEWPAADAVDLSADVKALLASDPSRGALDRLEAKLDAERQKAKAPHLEAGRQVDAKFKPLIEQLRDAKLALRKAELEPV